MLDDNHEKRKRKSNQPITEFYTTFEILQKYGISESGLYKIAKIKIYISLADVELIIIVAIGSVTDFRKGGSTYADGNF